MKEIGYLISEINRRSSEFSKMSPCDYRQQFEDIKKSIEKKGKSLDDVLVDVYALIYALMSVLCKYDQINLWGYLFEVDRDLDIEGVDFMEYSLLYDPDGPYEEIIYKSAWNVCGQTYKWDMIPYDVQLQGAIELHRGKIAQINTGEGKTLVSVFPIILNSLSGKHTHVMTANGYLSRRDFELLRPIYSFFGLKVACLTDLPKQSSKRKDAYNADIVYGSYSEFVFDYLFDNVSDSISVRVQNSFDFLLIDEADSILIDESQTPHIVTTERNDEKQTNLFEKYLPVVEDLLSCDNSASLFEKDEIRKSAKYTENGKKYIKEKLGNQTLFNDSYPKEQVEKIEKDSSLSESTRDMMVRDIILEYQSRIDTNTVLSQLLIALTVYHKDKDYIVSDEKIVIIDENTGRQKPSHRWSFGLHEAIEAKENVKVTGDGKKSQSARISLKNYIKRYKKISGMTGTAIDAKNEFKKYFDLDISIIPPNKPVIRRDLPIRVFKTRKDEITAILKATEFYHEKGQPVLIGVSSIRQSDRLQDLFAFGGIETNILNAREYLSEAKVIAGAGKVGAITIATSIAGRGTDIKPEEESLNKGGLVVLGMGVSTSRRIDQQLIGRTGRQGNPGISQLFASLDDDIFKFLSVEDRNKTALLDCDSNGEITSPEVIDLLNKARSIQAEERYEVRCQTHEKDDSIDAYRELFYGSRAQLLAEEKASADILKSFGIELDKEEVDSHRKRINLYLKPNLFTATRSIQSDMRGRKIGRIPFIKGENMFAVECDFIEAINTDCASVMDKIGNIVLKDLLKDVWKTFINETNRQNLSPDSYDSIYKTCISDLKSSFYSFFLEITPPLYNYEKSTSENTKESSERTTEDVSISQLSIDDLCPCGSGKVFGDCHGRYRIVRAKAEFAK